jgi:hypothetical protein
MLALLMQKPYLKFNLIVKLNIIKIYKKENIYVNKLLHTKFLLCFRKVNLTVVFSEHSTHTSFLPSLLRARLTGLTRMVVVRG